MGAEHIHHEKYIQKFHQFFYRSERVLIVYLLLLFRKNKLISRKIRESYESIILMPTKK